MLREVQAIILRTVKYSESSIIFDAFTLELGLRTYIISGVRKKNAKVSPALIRPMSLVEMIVYHQEEKDINRTKEIKPSYLYQKLPFDIAKGAVGLFITEVAQKSIKEVTENPELFHFLNGIYQLLDNTTHSVANFSAWFLVQFSVHLGLSPTLTNLSPKSIFDYQEGEIVNEIPNHSYYFPIDHTHLMAGMQSFDFDTAAGLELPAIQKRAFVENLVRYYQYHIESFGVLNSLVVLQEVFS